MAGRIDDNVFGKLMYAPGDSVEYGFWYGSGFLPLLGQTVQVILEAVPGQNPTERQKQIYQTFAERQMDLKEDLQEALFAYYQEVQPEYAGFSSVEDDESIPVLSRSDQIWGLLTPESVGIFLTPSFLSESNEDLAISWDTTWDIGMYLHANYRGLSLISVDQN